MSEYVRLELALVSFPKLIYDTQLALLYYDDPSIDRDRLEVLETHRIARVVKMESGNETNLTVIYLFWDRNLIPKSQRLIASHCYKSGYDYHEI